MSAQIIRFPERPSDDTELSHGASPEYIQRRSDPSGGQIGTDELYPAPELTSTELQTALHLLTVALRYCADADRAFAEDDTVSADDSIIHLGALLPELFCCRKLGDGFAGVVNAVQCALEGLDGLPLRKDQFEALKEALEKIRQRPFLSDDSAVDVIEKLEATGLNVEPQGFEHFVELLDGAVGEE